MRACGCGERSSLQCAIRGRKMSSAKRVWPVTFARASTLRRGQPITRRSLPLALEASTGVRESFSFGMRPPECSQVTSPRHLRYGALLVGDFEHRGLDSLKNLKITGAPAEISRDCLADLIASGVRIVIQQSFRSHQNCRGAIAALRCAEIGKRILQGMKVSVFSQAFDRQNLLSTTLERKHETGKHGLTVQKNGASAAFSEFTAVLRARVAEILAQYLQQGLIRCEGDVCLFTVQRQSYLCRFLRFDGQRGHAQSPPESITGLMCLLFCLADRSADGATRFSVKRKPLESIWFGQQTSDQIVGKV